MKEVLGKGWKVRLTFVNLVAMMVVAWMSWVPSSLAVTSVGPNVVLRNPMCTYVDGETTVSIEALVDTSSEPYAEQANVECSRGKALAPILEVASCSLGAEDQRGVYGYLCMQEFEDKCTNINITFSGETDDNSFEASKKFDCGASSHE